MAKYVCLRTVDFDGGIKNSGKKFVPGMIHVGDEPKCGKGVSLLKSEDYRNRKGKMVAVGPAFELIPEPKKKTKKKKASKGKDK